MIILAILYVMAALWLAVYAFNAYLLTSLYFLAHRRAGRSADRAFLNPISTNPAPLPRVTIQLPIYNEALVINRLIEAVSRFDYPPHLLQIQVLDDSTDQTTEIARQAVEQYRQQGLDITLIQRPDRRGFKAGALENGLQSATGDFIAIFDADFVPPADFLQQTLPHLLANPQVGFVQARWGHLNRAYSRLTAAQALAIDGHFTIEQTARSRSGLLMNFNGTAGVWRRTCIADSGGWQHDTLCEDFDLSYRAQLAGWQVCFLPDVVAPAEIPPQLAAFKRQQFRWAKGSIQCLKKLGWPVLTSSFPWFAKLQALIHLSNYLVHPLMVIFTLITPLLIMNGGPDKIRFPLIYLSLGSLGPPFMYLVSQIALYPGGQWRKHYKIMPLLALIGGGVALSNTKAVLEALLGVGNLFRRTPKFNVATATDRWQNSVYRLPIDWLLIGELALSLYAFVGAWLAATNGHQFAVPFILLYAFSFGYVGGQGLWDARLDLRDWLLAHLGPTTGKQQSIRET